MKTLRLLVLAAVVAQIGAASAADLRHEGLSRMAEKGLNLGELHEQSGHQTA